MTEPFSFDAFCDRCDRPIRCREHIGTLCTHCAKPVVKQRVSSVSAGKVVGPRRPLATAPGRDRISKREIR